MPIFLFFVLENYVRLLVRQSGAEPLIRIMAQGDNANLLDDVIKNIRGTITEMDKAC